MTSCKTSVFSQGCNCRHLFGNNSSLATASPQYFTSLLALVIHGITGMLFISVCQSLLNHFKDYRYYCLLPELAIAPEHLYAVVVRRTPSSPLQSQESHTPQLYSRPSLDLSSHPQIFLHYSNKNTNNKLSFKIKKYTDTQFQGTSL